MLRAVNIHKSFKGVPVLHGVSFTIEKSSITGLIGPSGGGKSVLMKIIGSVLRPDFGEVQRSDEVAETPRNRAISLMFQEGALFDSLSVFDNIAFPLVSGKVPTSKLRGELRDQVQSDVSEVLERVGLTKAAFKMPAQLSGGMRRRVSLARALVSKPQLVLLDDPTAGLDPVASSVIMNLIVELHRQYQPTTLMVSHDLRRLFPVVDKINALFGGSICFSGTLDELKKCEHTLLRKFASCRYDLDA